MSVEMIFKPANISLTVLFDTVKIEMMCTSDYEAQVLFDDLKDRLEAGEEISIEPCAAKTER